MTAPIVGVVMGSDSDWPVLEQAASNPKPTLAASHRKPRLHGRGCVFMSGPFLDLCEARGRRAPCPYMPARHSSGRQ